MIKLPPIDKSIRDLFFEKQEKPFSELLKYFRSSSLHPNITNYFFNGNNIDEQKVKEVLVGELDSLIEAINAIGPIVGTSACLPHKEFIRLYKNFTRTELGAALFDKTQVTVCPYCNRSYIHTLRKGGVRPQYDHFFNKAKYPYLSISLYNLIPACSICNQAKSDTMTYDETRKKLTFLYPYRDEYGEEFFFKTEYKGDISYLLGGNENFDLKIDHSPNTDPEFLQIVKNTSKILNTEKLYEKHKDQVLDIIRACQIYNEEYLMDLFQKFPFMFNDLSDVMRMAFMNYLDKPYWGNRILAKLTHDIYMQFHI